MKIQGLRRFYTLGLKMAASARSSRDSVISVTVLGGRFSLQNMPQSVTVHELRWYSCWIWQAGSQHMMSYVMSKISRKVRLLCWNQKPCFMDLDSEHLTPATFFRHHHLKPSGILCSADHVISQPQVVHCTLFRSRPTSFRNCIAKPWSQIRYVRKSLFGPLSSHIGRPYEDLSMNDISCRHFLYSRTTSQSFSTIVSLKKTKGTAHDDFGAKNGCYTGTGGV